MICNKKILLKFSLVLFVGYSFIPFISRSSGKIALDYGYSTLWLLTCFIWGASIKRYIDKIIKNRLLNVILIMGIFISIAIPYSFCLLMKLVNLPYGTAFLDYMSPFCVIEAILILIACIKIQIDKPLIKKIICFLSTNSLGIYLFQCHPAIYNNIIKHKNISMSIYNALYKVPMTIFIIFIVGLLINVCIDKIFILLKINNIIEYFIKVICNNLPCINNILNKY